MARSTLEYYVNVKEGAQVLVHRWCRDTGSAYPQGVEPELTMQRICDAAMEDNACVTCAKASCCDAYGACSGDPHCVCLADCLSGGSSVYVCTLPENCGPADSVSTEAVACLDDACQAQCPNLGSLGGAFTHRSTSSRESAGAGGSGAEGDPFAGEAP